MKKLIVFDLDGTLADTLPTLTEAMNLTLASYSFPLVGREDIRRAIGNGMELLCRRCIPTEHRDDPDVYMPFLADYKRAYAECYLNIDAPYDGLRPVLDELKARGYTLAALSNKPHAYTVDIIEKLFGRGFFAELRGMCEGVPPKPDPTSLLDIARTLGFTAESTVMIGDSEPDIIVANNAGVACITVCWGYRTRKQLTEAGATAIAAAPEELLDIL